MSIFHISVKRTCTHKEVSVDCLSIDLDNLHVSKSVFAIFHVFPLKQLILTMSKSISVPKMHPFHPALQHTVVPGECCESWKQTNEKAM